MMGGYIPMDKDLGEDPRVKDLTEFLVPWLIERCASLSPEELESLLRPLIGDAILGGLYRLWRYADVYLGDKNRLKSASQALGKVTFTPVTRVQEVTGFPAALIDVFPKEWLRFHPDGSIELPDYAEKNALRNRDERRAAGRKRTKKWREGKRVGDASHGVTGDTSRVTNGKSHGDKNQSHENVTTGTGTGTGPDRTSTKPDRTGTVSLGERASGAEAPRSPSEEPKPRPTENDLRSMAQRLARMHRDEDTVTAVLAPYGATPDQVRAWLASPETP